MAKSIPVFLLFLLIFSTSISAKEESVGFFKNSGANVFLLRADKQTEVRAGVQVLTGDTIQTGPVGTAGIVFRDGTVLTLGSETEVNIRNYVFDPGEGQYAFFLYLEKGEVLYSSGKLGKLAPEKVNMQTRTASVDVHGSRIILSAK